MENVSSTNSYYRYKVQTASDLSLSIFGRRLKKIKKANTSIVLIDWSEALSNLSALQLPDYCTAGLTNYGVENLLSCDQFRSLKYFEIKSTLHIRIHSFDEILQLDEFLESKTIQVTLHISPRTKAHARSFEKAQAPLKYRGYKNYFWDFRPYSSSLKNSLTINDVHRFKSRFPESLQRGFSQGALTGLEIWNSEIPEHFELESCTDLEWAYSTPTPDPLVSVIIPSFNNSHFLTNVVRHLLNQDLPARNYEIIIVEDGGSDHTSDILQTVFSEYKTKANLKFIFWSKSHPERGPQNFFRAGLARNLGFSHSTAAKIIFLDSDMLVPKNFLTKSLSELDDSDLIQFQRFHIHQQLSLRNPTYNEIDAKTDTYTEEQTYWSELFNSDQWQDLNNYWKYTCTYALGIHRKDFLRIGRFKKYYVSYGFEDTDLGFEFYKLKKRFRLVKIPLLHLTSYNHMQYNNSQLKRTRLLRKTAALFYLQHLDDQIFHTLGNFYRLEKPLKDIIRDLF